MYPFLRTSTAPRMQMTASVIRVFSPESGGPWLPRRRVCTSIPQLIRRIEEMGVSRAFVTLHVGAGTFQPVRIDDLDAHVMHAERVSVSAATCARDRKDARSRRKGHRDRNDGNSRVGVGGACGAIANRRIASGR